MIIQISYSELQLEMAVKFICANNPYFFEKPDKVREDILREMRELATNRELDWSGSGGVLLVPDTIEESMEQDENVCYISIYVDPSVGHYPDDPEADAKDMTVSVSASDYWGEKKENE